jgi:hypothetical protein
MRLSTMVRLAGVATSAALVLTGCTPPGDTITEVETGVNGTKVETKDGREYYLRHGIDCETDERLWECANKRDLLVERK